ncbi:Hypothetical_protein [Hexamita inflata]|uniref:Hypothetical_protein n=1 Tax=Hexamita inflata TaxID=28002 RepID=A0AA86QJT5_9EUKA|nr:Hypothetical protein HINF_LOCUS47278 [Hexamita inflata]
MQLEQKLAQETGCFVPAITSRISDKATNQVNITTQLTKEEIEKLYNLSKILLEIMQSENVENIDTKFGQVYDFWESAQKEVTKEWFMKQNSVKLKVNYMFSNNGNVQSRSAKYTHKQIQAQIVNGVSVLIDEKKEKEDKKQRKREEQMVKKQQKEQMKKQLKEKDRQRGKCGVK